MRKLEKKSEQAYRELEKKICNNVLQQGARIVPKDQAKEMGASEAPIRSGS